MIHVLHKSLILNPDIGANVLDFTEKLNKIFCNYNVIQYFFKIMNVVTHCPRTGIKWLMRNKRFSMIKKTKKKTSNWYCTA